MKRLHVVVGSDWNNTMLGHKRLLKRLTTPFTKHKSEYFPEGQKHPKTQSELATRLFYKNDHRFIISTMSPFIIKGLKTEDVALYRVKPNRSLQLVELDIDSMTIDQIVNSPLFSSEVSANAEYKGAANGGINQLAPLLKALAIYDQTGKTWDEQLVTNSSDDYDDEEAFILDAMDNSRIHVTPNESYMVTANVTKIVQIVK